MSLHTGNSTVVNVLMRFPILVPVAAFVGVVAVTPAVVEPQKPEPMCIKVKVGTTGKDQLVVNPKFTGQLTPNACKPISKPGGG